MKKLLKIFALFMGGLLLIVAAGVVYVATTFDAARIKQEAAKAVLDKTGRTLTIDGNIALRFWPNVGIKAEKIALSEHNKKETFASFKSANVSVKVMPLLSGKIVANNIELDGLNVVLIRDHDGHLNIDDLIGGGKKDEKKPAPEIDVAGIHLTRVQLEWRDLKANSTLKIADLELATGHVVSTASEQSLAGLSLSTRGKLDADNFEMALEIPKLSRKGEQLSIAKVNLNAGLQGETRHAKVNLLVNDIDGQIGEKRQALKIGGLTLDLDAQMGNKTLKGTLKSPIDLDLVASSILLADLTGALSLDMQGLPSHPLTLPLKGRIKSEYGKASVSGNLGTQFDESHIDARFNVIGGAQLNVGVELDIDKLNVDKYLPPAQDKEEKTTDGKIDFSALKSVNGSATLHIGDLQVKNVKAKNLRMSFKAANGKVDIAPHSAELYGGNVSGAVSLDASGNHIALNEKLSNVAVKPLLADLVGKDMAEGNGDITMDISTQGDTVTAMKKALSGNARAVLRDGAIPGVNIAQMMRNAKGKILGGNAAQQVNSTDKTDFSELSASFVIANGVAHNDDLTAKSPFLRLSGSGDIDIGNSQLNYLIKGLIVMTSAGQGGKSADTLSGIPVPIRVSGSFDSPSYKLELGSLLGGSAKTALDVSQQDLKKQLQNNVGDKLKGLFKK